MATGWQRSAEYAHTACTINLIPSPCLPTYRGRVYLRVCELCVRVCERDEVESSEGETVWRL